MITDYTSLKAAVSNQFVTTEIVEFLDTAIGLVEADINRNVRVRLMMQRDTANLDSQFIVFPSDFLSVAGIQINTSPARKLDFVTIERMDEMKPNYTSGGVPRWFTIIGREMEFLPVPDSTYQVELTYYERLPGLVSNSTNWLVTNYPDVYFYGCLKQCANYVTDRFDRPDKRGATWSEMFDAAKEQMVFEDDRNRFSQGKLAMRTRNVYS